MSENVLKTWAAGLGIVAIGLIGMAIAPTLRAQSAALPRKPEISQPVQANTPPSLDVPEHIQAACMSIVRGQIPNGTRVNSMSVTYDGSVDSENHTVLTLKTPRVNHPKDIDFYIVTMEAEIEGKRFSSQYKCRHLFGGFDISRGY